MEWCLAGGGAKKFKGGGTVGNSCEGWSFTDTDLYCVPLRHPRASLGVAGVEAYGVEEVRGLKVRRLNAGRRGWEEVQVRRLRAGRKEGAEVQVRRLMAWRREVWGRIGAKADGGEERGVSRCGG